MHDDSLAGNSVTVHPFDDSRADDEVDGMFVMYVGFFFFSPPFLHLSAPAFYSFLVCLLQMFLLCFL